MKTNQGKIAMAVGVAREHLNALINGRKNPSPQLAIRLEQATGVARSVWIFGTAEERRAAWAEFREKARRGGSRTAPTKVPSQGTLSKGAGSAKR